MNGELGFKDWQEQDQVLEEQTTDKRIIQKYFTRYAFYINQSLFLYRLDLRSFWEIQTCKFTVQWEVPFSQKFRFLIDSVLFPVHASIMCTKIPIKKNLR